MSEFKDSIFPLRRLTDQIPRIVMTLDPIEFFAAFIYKILADKAFKCGLIFRFDPLDFLSRMTGPDSEYATFS